MKKITIIFSITLSLFVIIVGCENSQGNSDNYEYYGQTKPGLVPVIFAPEIISTAFHDVRITFTPDLKECYFYTVYQPNDSVYKWITLSCKYENGKWSFPEAAFFSGLYNDHAPCIHPDGSIFIYQSDRPIPDSETQDQWNFWIMKKYKGTLVRTSTYESNNKWERKCIRSIACSKWKPLFYTKIR